MPYRNAAEGVTHGRVLVNVAETEEGYDLHVYLDDIPVNIDDTDVGVYLDLDRLLADDEGVKEEDRAYLVNVDEGTQAFWHGTGGAWDPSEAPLPWDVVVGDCTPGERIESLRLCDIEYAIAIGESFAALGLAVSDRHFAGSSPPQMVMPLGSGDRSIDRTEYQTLFVDEWPDEGSSFRLISWNMRRFSDFMQTLLGDDFTDVRLTDQAELLHEFDIIAIQELWQKEDAETLLDHMNGLRHRAGLPPLMMHGPVQFPPSVLQQIQDAADELHGGLWIFSRFPAIETGYDVFDACIGQDCLKSKGVQWVRLALDPTGEAPSGCTPVYVPGEGYEPLEPAGCPRPATSEMFIDVFNTHLQANPSVCWEPSTLEYLGNVFTGGIFTELYDQSFHCFSTTKEEVQALQLDAIDALMDSVLADNASRQAILVGDFNIDGQALNHGDPGDRYGDMLERLDILSPGGIATGDEPDVTVHPHIESFNWDIDRGDLARDDPELVCTWDPAAMPGTSCEAWADPGTGTSIDTDPALGCTEMGETCRDNDQVPDGGDRIDYIFIRRGQWARLDYVLARTSGFDAYQSPWPELGPPSMLTFDGPPTRLSDHKPVVANLTLFSMRESPPFYPDVPHTFEFFVRSVDATGEDDCFLGSCNPVDLLSEMVGRQDDGSGATDLPDTPFFSSECEGWNISRVSDSCMAGWIVSDNHDPSTDLEHQGGARLFEADDSSPTDEYPTTSPSGHPLLKIDWMARQLSAEELESGSPLDNWTDVMILTNDSRRWCTKDRPVNMCVEVSFDELAP